MACEYAQRRYGALLLVDDALATAPCRNRQKLRTARNQDRPEAARFRAVSRRGMAGSGSHRGSHVAMNTVLSRRASCAAAAVVALSSCAGTQDAEAASVAKELLAAVAAGDGAGACALLAPAARSELEDTSGKPCDEAVLEVDVGEASSAAAVEVYDSMAQVRFGSETLFLSTFDGNWLVVGAACTPKPGDQPYDCSIQVS